MLIALTTRSGAGDDSTALGFPVVLAGLAVLVAMTIAWTAVAERRSR